MNSQNTQCYFDSIVDDILRQILLFYGKRSYITFGLVSRRFNSVFKIYKIPKQSFIYGHAPMSVIKDRYTGDECEEITKGIFYFQRADLLDWCVRKQDQYTLEEICHTAAIRGYLYILQQIFHNSEERTLEYLTHGGRLCVAAACTGQLDILIWLHEHGCPVDKGWSDCISSTAEHHGHLNVLKWLKQNVPHYSGSQYACSNAAFGGHLNVLRWLRQNGCQWSDRTIESASQNGHLNCIKYASANGCKYDKQKCLDIARINGHDELISWLNDLI